MYCSIEASWLTSRLPPAYILCLIDKPGLIRTSNGQIAAHVDLCLINVIQLLDFSNSQVAVGDQPAAIIANCLYLIDGLAYLLLARTQHRY